MIDTVSIFSPPATTDWFPRERRLFTNPVLLYFSRQSAELGTKRLPIVYPSGCQASFGGAVNAAVFPCLSSSPHTAMKPHPHLPPLRLTTLCQNTVASMTRFVDLHWRIYHLTSYLCIIHPTRGANWNLNADDVVSGGVCDSASLHNTLVKAPPFPLQAPRGTRDVRRPHYWTRCICWTPTVEKNEMSLFHALYFCF